MDKLKQFAEIKDQSGFIFALRQLADEKKYTHQELGNMIKENQIAVDFVGSEDSTKEYSEDDQLFLRTPLQYVTYYKQDNLVSILMYAGANCRFPDEGRNAMHEAYYQNYAHGLIEFHKRDKQAFFSVAKTPMLVCYSKKFDVIEKLLDSGVFTADDVNETHVDPHHSVVGSAIHFACHHMYHSPSDARIVELLVKHGADINKQHTGLVKRGYNETPYQTTSCHPVITAACTYNSQGLEILCKYESKIPGKIINSAYTETIGRKYTKCVDVLQKYYPRKFIMVDDKLVSIEEYAKQF
jgi:hypothetical protein